jgi:CRISPR-associated RAMP protein (TIGR02581 family)
MENPANFDQLDCRFIIRGLITNLTQLHIGSGDNLDFGSIENPLIRLNYYGEELPYIPGSTLKGIFRSEIERYFRSLGSEDTEICFPYDFESNCNNTEDLSQICLACKIFGNNQIGSHFIISDALLDTEKYNPGTNIKPGNAIDRITGTARQGALYQLETLQPGAFFKFEFQIQNIDLKEKSLLSNAIKYLLKELREGWIQIGGRRSTGLGQIQIKEANVIEIRPENLENLDFKEYNLDELI